MSLARATQDTDHTSQPTTTDLATPAAQSKQALPLITNPNTRPVLVLGLEGTLVHRLTQPTRDSGTGVNHFDVQVGQDRLTVLERPWAREFLASVARAYTLVIFSTGSEEYVKGVVAYLDSQGGHIAGHLSRDACTPLEDFGQPSAAQYTKDLGKVATDLHRVLLVDAAVASLDMQPDNGILIQKWFGDADDTRLPELEHFLLHPEHRNARDMHQVVERWTPGGNRAVGDSPCASDEE